MALPASHFTQALTENGESIVGSDASRVLPAAGVMERKPAPLVKDSAPLATPKTSVAYDTDGAFGKAATPSTALPEM